MALKLLESQKMTSLVAIDAKYDLDSSNTVQYIKTSGGELTEKRNTIRGNKTEVFEWRFLISGASRYSIFSKLCILCKCHDSQQS